MANNKKRAGKQTNKSIKTSKFLPSVFQTNLNKKWLDSTLDQMVSKGNLQDLDGYIGSEEGRLKIPSDVYNSAKYLEPAIVSKNKDGSIDKVITHDDVRDIKLSTFGNYNFSAAYTSSSYFYRPPVDIDKFVNFGNYYWVEELPVYESVDNTSTDRDITSEANNRLTYELKDKNESFLIEDGMLIKCVGTGWSTDCKDKTYLVTGVGSNITLILYKDETGNKVYNNFSQASIRQSDFWDKSNITTLSPNTKSQYYDAFKSPFQMLDDYFVAQEGPNKAPLFDGFIFTNDEEGMIDQFITGQIVMFSEDWNLDSINEGNPNGVLNEQDLMIPMVTHIENGKQMLVKLYDTQAVGTHNPPKRYELVRKEGVFSDSQFNKYYDELEGWDSEEWDSSVSDIIMKDYILINRNCKYQTAWSRTNFWVHKNTVDKVRKLTGVSLYRENYINLNRVAKRPILEFDSNMHLYNHVSGYKTDQFKGTIDFYLKREGKYIPQDNGSSLSFYEPSPVPTGSTIIFDHTENDEDRYKKVYRVKTDFTLEEVFTPSKDDVVVITNSTDYNFRDADLYYNGRWISGQQKTKINQAPLYQVYDYNKTKVQELSQTKFKGNTIFGYKIGTGTNDTELGFPLSFKDGPKGAEYLFENYLDTALYESVYRSEYNLNVSNHRKLDNQLFFKVRDELKFNYELSKMPHGSREKYNYTITDTNNLEIPFGFNNWRTDTKVMLHSYFGKEMVTELVNPGMYSNRTKGNNRHIVASPNNVMEIVNLIENNEVIFLTPEGEDIETLSDAGNPYINLQITRLNSSVTEFQFTQDNVGLIVEIKNSHVDYPESIFLTISNKSDDIYYKLSVNGKKISRQDYNISLDRISVKSNKFNVGDIVDLEFLSNGNTIPETQEYNPNNKLIDTFTITETLDHWKSLLNYVPDLTGDSIGENNYSETTKLIGYGGGKIFVHEDVSITHDINYSDNALNITGALQEQGKDWDSFRARFISQVRRLYSTKEYKSVYDLSNDAINLIVQNRKGSPLYKDSNMAYGVNNYTYEWPMEEFVDDYWLPFTYNTDEKIKDHLYVYLKDDSKEENKFTYRPLVKDVDYKMVGNKLTVLCDVIFTPNLDPVLLINYYNMDLESYIPPSPVKLGLQFGYKPTVLADKIICHDGYEYSKASDADLYDFTDSKFDPVVAALYDLEIRIYNGLVMQDNLVQEEINPYKSAYDYMPSLHRSVWYDLLEINSYTEQFFNLWLSKNNISDINPDSYFDTSDENTWNYKSEVDALGDKSIPGHWVGAYTAIFGTSTPHLTPWHMLGFSFKPTWWDNKYSWTNTVKRNKLLTALRLGNVSPNDTIIQDLRYARYNWDWEDKCPVTSAGTLESISTILGMPSELNRSVPFEFGDWGPVEQEWRKSAIGYMSLVDAVVKLSPGLAWNEFIQPGSRTGHNDKNIHISERTKNFMNSSDYLIPGNVYGKTITGVKLSNTEDAFDVNATEFNLIGPDDTPIINTAVSYFDLNGFTTDINNEFKVYKFISGASVLKRGYLFEKDPTIVSSVPRQTYSKTTLEILTAEVPYVSNGILQAQHNYILRNQYNIDLKQIYSTIDTQLTHKLNGFSNNNLLKFKADSSLFGPVELSSNDFELQMYTGACKDNPTASNVTITKQGTYYVVKGLSSNKQEFLFYEPDLSNSAKSVELTLNDYTFRKYENFVQAPSVAEFGTKFSRIQDTYNFIRGYWEWMNVSGYTLELPRDAAGMTFVKWAVAAGEGDSITIELGKAITFKPQNGTVEEYNKYGYHDNDILSTDGKTIENKDLGITREDGTVYITTKDNSYIGSVSSVVVEHEHVAVINNTTSFGVNMLDQAKGNRYDRLFLHGQKTPDWTGEKKALGYLVQDNGIVENFDTSAETFNDFYRTDVNEFNNGITKSKDLTIGNQNDILDLNLDSTTLTNFYQGAIKKMGTNDVINGIDRAKLNHGLTTVNIHEQYMFRHSYMGDTSQLDSTEFKITSNDLKLNPQVITFNSLADTSISNNVYKLATGNPNIIKQGNTSFETIQFDDTSLELLSAGEVLESETRYTSTDMDSIKDVFDNTADYAVIETWNNTSSYKRGDQVRHKGSLYKCNIDATGISTVSDEIIEIGSFGNPVFDFGTTANIADTVTTLQSTKTVYSDIVAVGSINNPTITNTNTLTINATPILFSNLVQQREVQGPAIISGNKILPSFNDVTNKSITVGSNAVPNIFVNFDTTPANKIQNFTGVNEGVTPGDIIETFTGDGTQTNYTIAQVITTQGYDVASVTINGVVTTDFTLAGQILTFNIAPLLGDTIVVTLAHDTIISLKDTFTITVETIGSGTPWSVGSVKVSGNILSNSGYSVNGQDITFVTAPAQGVPIEVTIVHVPISMNTNEIVSTINNAVQAAGENNISASISSNNTLTITLLNTNDPDEILRLSGGGSNALLGFNTSETIGIQDVALVAVQNDLPLSLIVSQINAASVPNVIASVNGNNLQLTSTNTTMSVSGNAVPLLGLENSYDAGQNTVNTTVSAIDAVSQIQQTLSNAGITDVLISLDAGRIKITSTRTSLNLGDTEFNSTAFLNTGIVTSTSTSISNEFNYSEWIDITDQDPALFNIWVADDSAYELSNVSGVTTKFYGWNVFQATNTGMQSQSSSSIDDCGICAGTVTQDGNDAEVTTNIPHNLSVGDYVMLLNTTTTPNIDGIHKVTQVSNSNANVFYIDKFIEICGNAVSILTLRTMRFETTSQRDTATSSTEWNIPNNAIGYTNKNDTNERTTNVFTYLNSSSTWTKIREQSTRVTNNDLSHLLVYNTKDKNLALELELFDPARGIIPGVADREIDLKTTFDPAAYNSSSDPNYAITENDCWTSNFVGKRWWDTSTVKYYDYDQGLRSGPNGTYTDYDYMTTHWGKLFPGSEIIIWEWTASTVPPDDYKEAVEGNVVMFGSPATGEAYSIFDVSLNENLYFYTTDQMWNPSLGKYTEVYYFWVKNKETISNPNYRLTNKAIGDIIEDPTSNGISWFAAINSDTIIVSNISAYVDDNNTVLQINRKTQDNSHSSWMLIAEDNDVIPDYWYIGLRNNYSRLDSELQKIPDNKLHPENRIGDDRSIKQVWFTDIDSARYNGVFIINDLFKSINIFEDFNTTWTSIVNDDYNPDNRIPFSDKIWKWSDYYTVDYNPDLLHTDTLDNTLQLQNVDTNIHSYVKVRQFVQQIDRSEYYLYINNEWNLVRKENSTVAFDAKALSETIGWDMAAWDSISWDNTFIQDYWIRIVDALRNVLFVGKHRDKFNTFFFETIKYVIAAETKIDWVHKSTYVQLLVDQTVSTNTRVYKKNDINTIIGYVNKVKPFHTKLSDVFDYYNTPLDVANLSIEENVLPDDGFRATLSYPQVEKKVVGNELKDRPIFNYEPTFSGTTHTSLTDWRTVATLDYPVNTTSTYTVDKDQYVLGVNEWAIAKVLVGTNEVQYPDDYIIVDQDIVFGIVPTQDVTVVLKPARDRVYDGGSFTDTDNNFEELHNMGTFTDFTMYNDSLEGAPHNTIATVRPEELLNITVQTNEVGSTSDSKTRTFMMIKNNQGITSAFGLPDSKASTLSSDFGFEDTSADITDATAFADVGFAVINLELIKFVKNGNVLNIIQRGLNGTFSISHSSGDTIVDVTNAYLVSENMDSQRFNEIGKSLLDSDGSLEASELLSQGRGIDI